MQDVNSEEKILSLLPEFREELYTCKTTEHGLNLIRKYYNLFMFNDLHYLANYLSVKECDYLNKLFTGISVKGSRKDKLWRARSFYDSMRRVDSIRI